MPDEKGQEGTNGANKGSQDATRNATITTLKMRAFERFPIAFVLTNPNLEDNPIIYVNHAFETLTGYAADAAVGRNCRFLQGPDTADADCQKLRDAIKAREAVSLTLLNYRADGRAFYNRLRIEPIYSDDGSVSCFLGLQQRAERSAGENETVTYQLQEIQHRVKNHLQMIVSMIRLQSERPHDAAEQDYRALAHRVETLQLLYQEMSDIPSSQTGRSSVPMGAYVSRIASAIGHLEGRENVRLNIRTESFDVSVDTAARVGLIASEIITNAFQHAFVDSRGGLVEVTLRHLSQGVMRLEVMDDGVGMSENTAWPNTNSMGGSIVRTLADGISAKLSVTRGVTGTAVIVDIPFAGETNLGAN